MKDNKTRLRKALSTAVYATAPESLRNRIHSFKRFTFFEKKKSVKKIFIYCVDGSLWHGGLTDRFKGMISSFAFCLANNLDFRVHYTYPFHLTEYVQPNEYDWRIDDEEVSYSIFKVKLINLIGNSSIHKLTSLKVNRQIHCTANRDVLPSINKHYEMNFKWGVLFKQLIRPTKQLATQIESHKKLIGSEYIGVNFRFQNTFGDFAEYDHKPLPSDKRELIIDACLNGLQLLLNENFQTKFIITADSSAFLSIVQSLQLFNVYVVAGVTKHVDNINSKSNQFVDFSKSFIDFYLLSDALEIYSIGTKEMYASEFPKYAAQINDIPFKRIIV